MARWYNVQCPERRGSAIKIPNVSNVSNFLYKRSKLFSFSVQRNGDEGAAADFQDAMATSAGLVADAVSAAVPKPPAHQVVRRAGRAAGAEESGEGCCIEHHGCSSSGTLQPGEAGESVRSLPGGLPRAARDRPRSTWLAARPHQNLVGLDLPLRCALLLILEPNSFHSIIKSLYIY